MSVCVCVFPSWILLFICALYFSQNPALVEFGTHSGIHGAARKMLTVDI